MRPLPLGKVYPITSLNNRRGWTHFELVERYLQGGGRFFQVRDTSLSDSAFYHQLLKVRSLCDPFEAKFLVNNRVDLALAVKAHGVHLGQDDLPVAAARKVLGNEALIGLSTHNRDQFLKAQREDIDYLALGPLFPTSTKATENPPVGLETLRELVAESRVPVVAIGGISLERAEDLWTAGARSVAVISDITQKADPARRVAEYLALAKDVQ
ncbi:MAG: thiamine phosphate synthase [Acidobacteriota bacterium]|nr:thiamine phosphate synthase [Acidobacteriota bacterium]